MASHLSTLESRFEKACGFSFVDLESRFEKFVVFVENLYFEMIWRNKKILSQKSAASNMSFKSAPVLGVIRLIGLRLPFCMW